MGYPKGKYKGAWKRPDLVAYNLNRKGSGWVGPMKGKHHSEESKKKIVANRDNAAIGRKLKGRVYSDETLKRMSESKLGEKNAMYGIKRPKEMSGYWKGGITETNHNWRRSTKWKEIRRTVIIRDEFKCTRCGILDVRFDVHHVNPYKKCPELKFDETNLVTLCKDCHKETHRCQ